MASPLTADRAPRSPSAAPSTASERVAPLRALAALVWAAALVIAVGGDVPRTDSDVPFAAAALLLTYPLIDVVASILVSRDPGPAVRMARISAVVSAVAVLAVGVAVFGFDAGATLIAFGAWAVVSGALQLAVAWQDRRAGRQIPMIVSGGLSVLAGLSFIASAAKTDANLAGLAGYMALGAILYLVWAYRSRTA